LRLPTAGRSLRLCERKEERNESHEPRAKKLDPFAVRSLCAFASLRAKKEKLQETRSKKQEPFAHKFLCVFAALRAKIKMLENEPSLLARAFMSLLPCGLKKVTNFRSPQKTKVTCR
jgi:hypothetical protein